MSSSEPKRRFGDIVTNIDSITTYTAGMTEQQFRANQLVVDATERCLARISEAAVKLGPQAEQLAPDQPWSDIRGIGNWLRHGYDELSQETVWDVVSAQLATLRAACIAAISQLDAAAAPTSRPAGPDSSSS